MILHVQAHKNVLVDNVLKSQVILVKIVSEAVMKIMLVVVRHIRHVMMPVVVMFVMRTQLTKLQIQVIVVQLDVQKGKNVNR